MREVTKKSFYQKWWFWVIVAIVVISAYSGGGGENPKQPIPEKDKISNKVTKEEPKEEKKPEVTEKTQTSSAEPTMSKEDFEKIQNGMSYEEVVQIIGGEGELTSESTIAEYTTKLYTWKGEGGFGANANITFQNNKVQAKAQFGLK